MVPARRIDRVDVRVCRLPVEDGRQSDGTAVWDATTMVIALPCAAGVTGLGYSYIDGAAAGVIRDLLAPAITGLDAFALPAALAAMLRAVRNHGRPGMAERFAAHGVVYFEEPVSSDDLEEGPRLLRDRAPAGIAIAAGEYGYDAGYLRRMLEAGAVDILQADATRALGITGFLAAAALCAARSLPHAA